MCGGSGAARGCLSQILLNHDKPILFAKSQWFRSPIVFSIYRTFLALYLLAWLTILFSSEIPEKGSRCFIYLSEWTFIMVNCYLLVAAFGTVYHNCKYYRYSENHNVCHSSSEDPPLIPPAASDSVNPDTDRLLNGNYTSTASERSTRLPFYFKISWALFNICLSVCPMVTIIFWGLLYTPGAADGIWLAITIHVHAIGTLAVYVDLWVSAMPMRIAHLIYPILYGGTYVMFSVVYWSLGGVTSSGSPAIYPILDWQDKPLSTVGYLGVACIIMIGAFTVAYAVYRLRVRIYNNCCKEPSRESRGQRRVIIDYDNMTHDRSHDPVPAV